MRLHLVGDFCIVTIESFRLDPAADNLRPLARGLECMTYCLELDAQLGDLFVGRVDLSLLTPVQTQS